MAAVVEATVINISLQFDVADGNQALIIRVKMQQNILN